MAQILCKINYHKYYFFTVQFVILLLSTHIITIENSYAQNISIFSIRYIDIHIIVVFNL
jgi:hypothetical protein